MQMRHIMNKFTEDNLKEVFALFTSATFDELTQIYDKNNRHYFENEKLDDEYHLSEEKREISLDSLRSVLYFLTKHGYRISKGNEEINSDYILKSLFVK
jgi:transcriptional regulator NrdR family protein